jgi:hypothetical protein
MATQKCEKMYIHNGTQWAEVNTSELHVHNGTNWIKPKPLYMFGLNGKWNYTDPLPSLVIVSAGGNIITDADIP